MHWELFVLFSLVVLFGMSVYWLVARSISKEFDNHSEGGIEELAMSAPEVSEHRAARAPTRYRVNKKGKWLREHC